MTYTGSALLCLAWLWVGQPLLGAGGCEALAGKWAWFVGGEVTVAPDGTFTQPQSGAYGTWTCTDASKRIVTMKWSTGFVNTVVLASDGLRLSSADRSQAFVSARRVGNNSTPPQPQQQQQPTRSNDAGAAADETAFAQGRKLAASGQCQAAIPYLDQAVRLNPRHFLALSDRGRCKAKLGQAAQGIADLDRAVEVAPDEMGPYYNRAGLKADAGDGEGALADLDWSIRLMPMNAAGHAARAGLMERMGRTVEARLDREIAYKLMATFKSSQRATVDGVLQAWMTKRVGRPVNNASPGAGNPIVFASRALSQGRVRAALATLDAALAARPGDESLLAFRARLHREIGQPNQALEDLARIPQSGVNAALLVEKGRALRQLCQFKEELAQYGLAIRAEPRYVPAYFERAFTVMFFHKGGDAIPDLTKVIELEPNHWLAYNYRGDLHRYWFHLRESIADFRQSIAINPNFAQAKCNLAFALRSGRLMKEAEQWLAKCFALDPSEREVARREYAKIKAGEEQGARDLKSHMLWLRMRQQHVPDNERECNQGIGVWMGGNNSSNGGWCWI